MYNNHKRSNILDLIPISNSYWVTEQPGIPSTYPIPP